MSWDRFVYGAAVPTILGLLGFLRARRNLREERRQHQELIVAVNKLAAAFEKGG